MKLIKIFALIAIVIFIGLYEFIGFSIFNASEPDNNAPKKFYVINLDRAHERFENTKKQADMYNVPIERFIATDGYKIIFVDHKNKNVFTGKDIKEQNKEIEKNHKYDVYCSGSTYQRETSPDFVYDTTKGYDHLLSAGEIGLICSIRKLWTQIANSDQLAVIFEDDALLLENFDKNIQNIFASLPSKWDIIYIDILNHNKITNTWLKYFNTVNTNLLRIKQNAWGTHAYILNKKSAPKLLALYDQNSELPLDVFLSRAIKDGKLYSLISKYKIADVRHEGSQLQEMGRNP